MTDASTKQFRVAVAEFGQARRCHAETWSAMSGATVVGVYALCPDAER